MAHFNDTLMLLAMEPTRYLSIRNCAILERVSKSTSAISWLCYPVVTDLSGFGITDQMTHNAFSDLPRHCTAFFRRFDCNILTSLRVPWNPQTIVIMNGISYSDAGMLLEKCPNLVEVPPIHANFEDSIGFDNMLSDAQKRLLQSLTLYSDLSHYGQDKLLNLYRFESRVSSTSVCRLEIAVKIPFNIDYAIDTALGAFIRFINLRFDVSAVKSLKVFVTSNFKSEDRRVHNAPREQQTSVYLADMLQGWTSLEELSITVEHSTTAILLDGPSEVNLNVFSSLRTFSFVPLHCASVPGPVSGYGSEFLFNDGITGCMPVLQHLNIGSSSIYVMQDVYVNSQIKTRKEILERTILILNENKIERVQIGSVQISKDVFIPEMLDRIGESGCLRHFGMRKMSVSADSLLNFLKRNKDLELIAVIDCDGIGDNLFTLLTQAQLRNLSLASVSPCTSAGIRRYIKWRIRQIENGRALAHLKLAFGPDGNVAALFPNIMNPEEVLERGRITLLHYAA